MTLSGGSDFLLFVFVSGLFFLLPGILATLILFPDDQLDWLERIPTGFGLALGLFLAPVATTRLFAWQWSQLIALWCVLIVALAIGAWLAMRRPHAMPWRWFRQPANSPHLSEDNTLTRFSLSRFWTAVFFAILIASSVLTLFTPRDEDDWSYFREERVLADSVRLSLTPIDRNTVNVWSFLHALMVRVADLDLVRVGQDWLPLVLAPMAMLAFYGLARALFQNQSLAFVAVVLQFGFLFADLFNPDEVVPWPGWWFWARTDQEHTVAIFLLMTVLATLVLHYLREGTLTWLIAAWLVLLAMMTTHVLIGVILSSLVLGCVVLLSILFLRQAPIGKRLVWLLIPFGLTYLAVTPIWSRVASNPFVATQLLTPTDVIFPFIRHRFTFFSPTIYTMRVDVWSQSPALLMLILLPGLLLSSRTSLAARFLLASAVGLMAAMFFPPLYQLLETRMGVTIMRLWNWMPKALVIAFFIPHLSSIFRGGWRDLQNGKWSRQVVGAGIGVFVLVGLVVLAPMNLRRDLPETLRGGQRLPEDSHALLRVLGQVAPEGGTVLAWRDVTDAVPAYRAQLVPILFRENPKSLQRADADKFFQSTLLTTAHFEILEKYAIQYVIIPGWQELAYQFEFMPDQFALVYRNAYGSLYRVVGSLDPAAVIDANTTFAYGLWDEAILQYAAVLEREPNNALAHLGLGMLYQKLDKPKFALAELESAARLAPNNVQVNYHLVWLYRKLGMEDKAAAHLSAAKPLMLSQ